MGIGTRSPSTSRWAIAAVTGALTSLLVLSPAPSGASADQTPTITVEELTVPDGVRISVADQGEITRRGSVLVRIDEGVDPLPPTGWAVWHRGLLTPLTPPEGALSISAQDMSEHQHVVGTVQTCLDRPPACVRPYIWDDDGQPTPLLPEGETGYAVAVNDHGQALVRRPTAEGMAVWDDGRIVTPPPGDPGFDNRAVDINNRGQVALAIEDPGESVRSRAGIWQVGDPGGVIDLGTLPDLDAFPVDINDRGVVVGRVHDQRGRTSRAVMWRDGEVIELDDLGWPWSSADAINERGEVLGRAESPNDGRIHYVLWRRGRMTVLGPVHAATPLLVPSALNNRGQAVGTATWEAVGAPPGLMHAQLWQDGRVTDLGAVPDPQQPSVAYDINDRGQVLGEAGGRPVIWTVRAGRPGDPS